MLRSPLITIMVAAARKAGRALIRDFGELENLQVSVKGPGNFVTNADRRSEEILHQELSKARPKFGFLMEERGRVPGSDPSHEWVVDPLDGTTNFMHGIPLFAISIGLVKDGIAEAGVVYNPVSDELYVAEKGRGAYLNERRLRVAARRELADCVVCCGIPHSGRGDLARFRAELAAVQERVAGVRRTGSAALDLAWIASGRFDGFWERGLSPWDLAAGMALIREAGGFATDLDGGDGLFAKGSVCAGNELIQKQLLEVLKSA